MIPIVYTKFPSEWMINHHNINDIIAVDIIFEGEKVLTEWICFCYENQGSEKEAIEKIREKWCWDYTFSAYRIDENDWNDYRKTVEHY